MPGRGPLQMNDAKPEGCHLCSKEVMHAPGASIVEVMLERDGSQHVFHLDCFVAFTTGTSRDGDIWTYRIVATPLNTAASP